MIVANRLIATEGRFTQLRTHPRATSQILRSLSVSHTLPISDENVRFEQNAHMIPKTLRTRDQFPTRPRLQRGSRGAATFRPSSK